MRSCSAVVGPARRPGSRWAWRTRWRRVSGAQPILAAIEQIAADWEACSPWWSNTIRTARARTSGEYGGMRLVMAPSFQDQEPPEVVLDADQVRVAVPMLNQIFAHTHQRSGAARSQIETAEKLLAG